MRGVVLIGLGALLALFMATHAVKHATRHGMRAESIQPRAARLEDLAREVTPPLHYARANSFWGESSLGPCAVSAVWAAHIAFAPTLRLEVRAPAVATAPKLEPGADPVVRVVDFRPRARPRPERRYDMRQAA
jgi:hypothetical protein